MAFQSGAFQSGAFQAGDYVLVADGGLYVLSGTAADLLFGRKLAADSTSFIIVGKNARLRLVTVHAAHGDVPRGGTQGTNADRSTSAATAADRLTTDTTNADRKSSGKASGWRSTSTPTNRYRGH